MESNELRHTTVFYQGEEGWHTYRIPSLLKAKNGTLVALAEGRRDCHRDPGHGHIDLVYKLSYDAGLTWSARRFFDTSLEGWGASNPTGVVVTSGRILVVYNRWKPGYGGKNSRPGTRDCQLWLRWSDDHGETWSEPEDITAEGRDIENWGKAVAGPGRGLETKTGRLVIPVNAPRRYEDQADTAAFALYSDDGGRSWRRGEPIDYPSSESQIVELDDGRLLIDARQKDDSERRRIAVSEDQGLSWTPTRPGVGVTQICAGLLRQPRAHGPGSFLIWTGPKGPGRVDMVLRLSQDQGQSYPGELAISAGPAAYSSLTSLDEAGVGILWEGGVEYRHESIFFTRVDNDVLARLARN